MIIGFDARKLVPGYYKNLIGDKVLHYLIGENCEIVVSIDSYVTPDLLSGNEEPLVGYNYCNYIWYDFARMFEYFSGETCSFLAFDTVAGSKFHDYLSSDLMLVSQSQKDHVQRFSISQNISSLDMQFLTSLQPTNEMEQIKINSLLSNQQIFDVKDWTFLGYDIADLGFLSGLSRCGCTSEEMQNSRKSILEGHININYLIESKQIAIKYADWCDLSFPTHAPFFSVGIYALRQGQW